MGLKVFFQDKGLSKNLVTCVCRTEVLLKAHVIGTNLDSILKSRHITLLTEVRLVKVMVFPVVMCGCESWTIKKDKFCRIDAFEL